MKTKLLYLLAIMTPILMAAGSSFEEKSNQWRAEQEATLRSEGSWLSVVGLHWLKEGETSIGSSDRATIILPEGVPVKLGRIRHSKKETQIQFDTTEGVSINGKPVQRSMAYELKPDTDPMPSEITVGTVKFFLIKRANGVGVRVKDSNSAARKNFKGRHWFKPDPKWVIKAKWVPLNEPKTLIVPDIIGNSNEEKTPGFVSFKIDGKEHTLYPTVEGDDLFFVFNDQTSGKETYGAGRFLYAKTALNGEVTLDFNQAVNPPCAFTNFATCPLPPKENRLQTAIHAGELKDH